MIVPTIGRVVWVLNRYHASSRRVVQPEVGLIAFVHGDRLINVAGFDRHGLPFALTELRLLQDDDPISDGSYAQWMPYQMGQAVLETVLRECDPSKTEYLLKIADTKLSVIEKDLEQLRRDMEGTVGEKTGL